MRLKNQPRSIELAGVDLAWQSERNPSAIAFGTLDSTAFTVVSIEPAVYGIDAVLSKLLAVNNLAGVAIDAPLIIKNDRGQRICEKEIGREYGSRHASCHTSNTRLYPAAKSVYLSEMLARNGINHLEGDQWQIECYPHPAIIEINIWAEGTVKVQKGKGS